MDIQLSNPERYLEVSKQSNSETFLIELRDTLADSRKVIATYENGKYTINPLHEFEFSDIFKDKSVCHKILRAINECTNVKNEFALTWECFARKFKIRVTKLQKKTVKVFNK